MVRTWSPPCPASARTAPRDWVCSSLCPHTAWKHKREFHRFCRRISACCRNILCLSGNNNNTKALKAFKKASEHEVWKKIKLKARLQRQRIVQQLFYSTVRSDSWEEELTALKRPGVKQNFWPLRIFWPIIFCQLFFSQIKSIQFGDYFFDVCCVN